MFSFLLPCRHAIITILLFSTSLCGGARASSYTWIGPANGLWTVAGNWNGGVPTSGTFFDPAIVVFGTNTTSTCNIPNLAVNEIHFTGTGNTISGTTALEIKGIQFVLASKIQDDAGGNTLDASLPLILSGSRCFMNVLAGTLTIAGNISGTTGFIKNGAGTLALTSDTANTFTGVTTVDQGVLQLNGNRAFNTNMIPGPLVIGNGTDPANSATVQDISGIFGGKAAVTINASGLLDEREFALIGALSGTGNIALSSFLTVGGDNSSSEFDGAISGQGTFEKTGTGTLTMTHDNTFTGFTKVLGGTLLINGSQPGSTVNVFDGTLGGNGIVGETTVGKVGNFFPGTIAPGVSGPGEVSMGNLSLDSYSTLDLDLTTAAAGGFDTLNVNGTLNLGGSSLHLNVAPNFSAAAGTKLVLIANDGTEAVNGTFRDLAEGATMPIANQFFAISYMDGTGNDVALTAITAETAAAPSIAGVGQAVNFTVSADASLSSALTFSWTFDDGGTATGASASHAFTTTGSHTASVVISDALGHTVTGSASVAVNAPLVGTGNDSDGDGFSDDFETGVNTDPNSAASTPTSQPPTADTISLLTIVKASVKLNFTQGISGKDSISFSGTLGVPAGFKPTGAKVFLDVGGVAKGLTLNAKGNDTVKLAISKTGKPAKYTASLKKGTFAAALADEGLTGDADIKPAAPRTVVFTLIFNNTILQKSQTLNFSAKKGKLGSASASRK